MSRSGLKAPASWVARIRRTCVALAGCKKTTATDDRVGTTTWRSVQGTGNCCENYLATTPGGRLLDYGGSFINFTDDSVATRSARATRGSAAGVGNSVRMDF